MVRQRGRTDLKTEQEIEAFAAMAEKPLASVPDIPDSEPLPSPAPDKPVAPKTAPSPSRARKPAKSTSAVLAPAMADWKVRNREPKTGGINFRASTSQLDLLRTAALVEELSQQKILERIVWPILEEKYGSGASAE